MASEGSLRGSPRFPRSQTLGLSLILTRFAFLDQKFRNFQNGGNKAKFPGTYRFPENPRIAEFPKSSNHTNTISGNSERKTKWKRNSQEFSKL